jgi:small subunit ribosomal protein S13
MPRIAGKDIPGEKKVTYALTYIYGIGLSRAEKIIQQTKINPDKRARDLDGQEINQLQKLLEKYPVEGDLRRRVNDNINRLKRIKSYRGLRHIAGLPTRGQRTRVNARTRKGKRKTVGAITKELSNKAQSTTEDKKEK